MKQIFRLWFLIGCFTYAFLPDRLYGQCSGYTVLETAICAASVAGNCDPEQYEFTPGSEPLPYLILADLEGTHQVRMTWFTPSGAQYGSWSIPVQPYASCGYFVWVGTQGNLPVNPALQGFWRIDFFVSLNGGPFEYVASEDFFYGCFCPQVWQPPVCTENGQLVDPCYANCWSIPLGDMQNCCDLTITSAIPKMSCDNLSGTINVFWSESKIGQHDTWPFGLKLINHNSGITTYIFDLVNVFNFTFSNLEPGDYTVEVDYLGCLATADIYLPAYDPPVLTVQTTLPNCPQNNGGAVLVNPPLSGFVFHWSNGQNGLQATNLAPGTYTVTATDVSTLCKTPETFTLSCATECIPLASLSNGLLHRYLFDGNTNDAAGGNNGTAFGGLAFTADRTGAANKAALFDGVNDSILTASSITERSITCWLKANTAAQMPIFQGGTAGAGYFIGIYQPGGIPSVSWDTTYGIVVDFNQVAAYVPFDDIVSGWHHLAVSWDGASAGIKIALDGKLLPGYIYNAATVGFTIELEQQPFALGSVPNPSVSALTRFGVNFGNRLWNIGLDKLNGALDDLRIYNRALTDDEIRVLGEVYAISAPDILCSGQSSATLTCLTPGAASYQWRNLNTNAPAGATATITPTLSATTDFEITATSGACTYKDTLTVPALTPVQISNLNANGLAGSFILSGGLPAYNGSTFASVTMTLQGNPAVTAMLTGLPAGHGEEVAFSCPQTGTYTVTVSDDAGCGNGGEPVDVMQSGIVVSGNIRRHSGNAVSGVNVAFSGAIADTVTTDAGGNYTRDGLAAGSNITLTPSRNPDSTDCISVRDLLFINAHITGIPPLQSPYQMIAADVNKSGSLTTLDLIELRRRLLGIYNVFPNNTAWRFIPADFVFPNPTNPFQANFPESVSLSNLQADSVIDFIAIKTGDATDCSGDAPGPAFLTLSAPHLTGNSGQQLDLDLTTLNFTNVTGLQFSVEWDSTVLRLNSVSTTVLPSFNSASYSITAGRLAFAYTYPAGLSLPNASAVITLHFSLVGPPGSSSPVSFVQSPTRFEVTNQAYLPFGLNVTNGSVAISGSSPCTLVTNTASSGPGSLMAALDCANASPGPDTIRFNIPGTGPHIILTENLSLFFQADSTVLDATTQPGWSLGNVVLQNGTTPQGQAGIYIAASGVRIYGLSIKGFTYGIGMDADDCIIGDYGKGNQITGGGPDPLSGISIWSGSDIVVQGNVVGLNASASAPEGTFLCCALTLGGMGASRVRIEGNHFGSNPAARAELGIDLRGSDITILNNTLGTDSTGTQDFGFGRNINAWIPGLSDVLIQENTSAYADTTGIRLIAGVQRVKMTRNRLFCNRQYGIFLNPDVNAGILPPALLTATPGSIGGSAAPFDTVEVFRTNNAGCPGAVCQGRDYLGTAVADAAGNWTLDAPFLLPLSIGDQVTATSTGGQNNTSAFAECRTVALPPPCPTDSLALVALYNATNGPGWTVKTNWLVPGQPLSAWYGVTVAASGCVERLELAGNNLTGALPAALGNLGEITLLNLSDNTLSGAIPPQLSQLTTLQLLNLSINQLTGGIPPGLGNLIQLQELYLNQNSLTGPIPGALTQLTQLQILNLSKNQLDGALPANVNQWGPLRKGYFNENKLTGAIPTAFGQLNQLTLLNLSRNQFTGNIPVILGNLNQLQELYLNENKFTGPIPPEFGQLAQIKHLNLSVNQLTGGIPPELGNLTSLDSLYLNNNQLSGCLPLSLKNLCDSALVSVAANPGLATQNWAAFCGADAGLCGLPCGNYAGTFSLGAFNGQSNDVSLDTLYLCFGDSLFVDHNGDATFGGDPFTFSEPGVAWLFSKCQPTGNGTFAEIILDNCNYLGMSGLPVIATGNDPQGDILFFNQGQVQTGLNNGQPLGVIFSPVTIDNFANYEYENGGPCVHVNTAESFQVVYLNAVSVADTATQSCGGTFRITGGLPEFEAGAAYGISIELQGNPAVKGTVVSPAGPPQHGDVVQFTVPAAGNYTIRALDGKSCERQFALAVPPLSAAISTPNGNTLTCSAATVLLQASGGNSYVWSNGLGTNANVTVSTPGLYTVTVTNTVAGCSATASATVNADQNVPNAAATGGNISCLSPAFAISGSTSTPGATWLWQGPGGFTSNQLSPVVNVTGAYTFTVTAPNGCTAFATAVVGGSTAIPAVTATGGVLTCNPSPVILQSSSSIGGSSFAWAGPGGFSSTQQNPAATQAGTYTVTVTAAPGCTATAQATVAQSLPPALSTAATQAGCGLSNGSINLTVGGGTAPYSFQWSHGPTAEDPQNLPAGAYTVTVTDAANCSATASAAVSNPNAPTASAVATQAGCGLSNGSINLTVGGGTAPYSFQWSHGSTAEDPQNLAAGTYSVTVTDAANCSATASAPVTNPNAPTASAIVTPAGCGLSNGSINLTVGGGTAPYSFQWSHGSTAEDPQNLAAGTYTVTVTDAANCSATASASVTSAGGAITADISETICPGKPYNFNGQVLTAPGLYTDTLQTVAGCDSIVRLSLSLDPIAVSLGPDRQRCAGAPPLTLSGTVSGCSGCQYQWNTGPATPAIAVNPSTDSEYILTVQSSSGCTASDTVRVSVQQPVLVEIDTALCPGAQLVFGPVTIQQAGTFTGNFQTAAGCDSTVSLTVTYLDANAIGAADDKTYMLPDETALTIPVTKNDTLKIAWTLNVILQPQFGTADTLNRDEIRYTRTNPDALGYDTLQYQVCPAAQCPALCDTAWVYIFLQGSDLDDARKQIPNGFAPESTLDSNSVFDPLGYLKAFGIEIPVENTRFFVYNRWGEIVYKASPYEPWSGRQNDRPLPQGAYYYRLVFIRDDRDEQVEGPVYLLR